MKIELSKKLARTLQSRIEGYQFEVGVLDDKPHRDPVETSRFQQPNLGSYAGGPVRKAQRKSTSGLTSGDVLIANMERLNVNLLSKPFEDQSTELNRFVKAFLSFAMKSTGSAGSLKRVENLLQAVVRNPILKLEYGSNRSSTADAKGFDRHLFDTGQMFKAIRARAKRV